MGKKIIDFKTRRVAGKKIKGRVGGKKSKATQLCTPLVILEILNFVSDVEGSEAKTTHI